MVHAVMSDTYDSQALGDVPRSISTTQDDTNPLRLDHAGSPSHNIFGVANLRSALTLFALIIVCTVRAGARSRIHTEKANVRFLTTSTLYRTTWGMNEDIYLAELIPTGRGEHLLAHLIDEYPNWFPPIPAEVLKSDSGTSFLLVRDASRDLPYAEMILRTAPGDPMAILLERLSYRPQLGTTPKSGAIPPYLRTVRP